MFQQLSDNIEKYKRFVVATPILGSRQNTDPALNIKLSIIPIGAGAILEKTKINYINIHNY